MPASALVSSEQQKTFTDLIRRVAELERAVASQPTSDSQGSAERLCIADLRDRYRRSDVTLWRWVRQGVIPKPHYLNGRRYWWRAELDAADAARTRSYAEQHANS